MRFTEKLREAIKTHNSLLCVGLDPEPKLMPEVCLSGGKAELFAFNRAIIDATADLVCAYKPNVAFYEAEGLEGMAALMKTIEYVPQSIPVIVDAKRGDIGSTAQAYARAVFEVLGADAVTVNPYLGHDALEPFLSYADRGVFILCRTSNPGSRDLQDLRCMVMADGEETEAAPLFTWVARKAKEWNTRGNVGLVVGATYPEELKLVRQLCPEMPLLIPGIGAQGGDLQAAVRNGADAAGAGAIIASSRQIIYASKAADFALASRRAALELRDAINRERASLGWGEKDR